MIYDEILWPEEKDCPDSLYEGMPDFNKDFVMLNEWRDNYYGEYNNGLDPDDFDSEEEFLRAVRRTPWLYSQKENTSPSTTSNIERQYYCCGVVFENYETTYQYLCDDLSIKIGDRVSVPVGNKGEIAIGTVVSIGKYLETATPYPIRKTKKIIKKEI